MMCRRFSRLVGRCACRQSSGVRRERITRGFRGSQYKFAGVVGGIYGSTGRGGVNRGIMEAAIPLSGRGISAEAWGRWAAGVTMAQKFVKERVIIAMTS